MPKESRRWISRPQGTCEIPASPMGMSLSKLWETVKDREA